MRKSSGNDVGWPAEKFNARLDEVMIAAGIAVGRDGRPKRAELARMTDDEVSASTLSRWNGENRPTTDKLRTVALPLAERIGMSLYELLLDLEIHAGLRSAEETGAPPAARPDPAPLAELRKRLHSAQGEQRQWMVDKIADLVEQIDAREAFMAVRAPRTPSDDSHTLSVHLPI